jgi:hypothetical protein
MKDMFWSTTGSRGILFDDWQIHYQYIRYCVGIVLRSQQTLEKKPSLIQQRQPNV